MDQNMENIDFHMFFFWNLTTIAFTEIKLIF